MAKPSITEDEHNFIKELDKSVYEPKGGQRQSSYVSYWITRRMNVNSKTVLSDTDFTFKLMKKLNVHFESPFLNIALISKGGTTYNGLLELLKTQETREEEAIAFNQSQLPSCSSSLTSDNSVQSSNSPPVKTNLTVDTSPSTSSASDASVSSFQERFRPVSITPKIKKKPVNKMNSDEIDAEIKEIAEKMDDNTLMFTVLNCEYKYEFYSSIDLEAAAITKLQRNPIHEYQFFNSIPRFRKQDHINLQMYAFKHALEYKNKFPVEDGAQYSIFNFIILTFKFPAEVYRCIPENINLLWLPLMPTLLDICLYFELVWMKYRSYMVPENCDIHPPWSEILKQQSNNVN